MPYISPDLRKDIDPLIKKISKKIETQCAGFDEASFAGILNYCFTRILMQTMLKNPIRYWKLALAQGILKTMGDELERRLISKYEDAAISQNGDVPEYRENFDI